MRKEWIRTEEERHIRKLKRLHKQQKKLDQIRNNSIIERKKNPLDFSIEFIQYKKSVIYFKIN